MSWELEQLCAQFLMPLLDLVLMIVIHRHRNQGLMMSELGGELLGAAHAPAGTKRNFWG